MEPISYLQAIILGALQGIAEPFPISSLGHAVMLPHLFGWNIHQNDEFFLSFLVATHCATALVLFLFFLEDWKRILFGFVRSVRGRATPRDPDARLAWLIIVGTIPAGILGLALEHKLRALFASPTSAAIFLTDQRGAAAGGRALPPPAAAARRLRGGRRRADRQDGLPPGARRSAPPRRWR